MNKQTVIITGANGFIGSELLGYFSRKGYHVIALARSKPAVMPENSVYVKYSLEDTAVDETVFEKADYIIHCAYVKYSPKQKNADTINLEGTRKLLEYSRKYKLKKFVFFSSFSAHPEALNHYGRTKLAIEKILDKSKDLILRPGLVIGNGGLYKAIQDIVSKNKFVPLLGGGMQAVQTIDINDLSLIIQKGMENDISGIYTVAEQEAITMKTLYKAIVGKTGAKKIFIHFPYWCAELLISLAGITRINISISKENISGLKKSRSYDIREMSEVFGMTPADYEATIEKIKKS
jgi:nucleoside-diphosphate-sugar epimerase